MRKKMYLLVFAMALVVVLPGVQAQQNASNVITNSGTIEHQAAINIGMNYLTRYHAYSSDYTPDAVLHRDFAQFKEDNIEVVHLSMYWYRLEGNEQGNYDGNSAPLFGDSFLDNIKHVSQIANEHGLKVWITFHTLWGDDSLWCTPDYVVDPVTGIDDGLAIVRSSQMRDAFVDMFTHTIDYLAGTPGIAAYAILNEPWYWGRTSNEHDFITENGKTQKENFIDLIQTLTNIAKTHDNKPTTIRFGCTHTYTWNGEDKIKNIFVSDWNWDQRILDTIDFISFTSYIPEATSIEEQWRAITSSNVLGCVERNIPVGIAECGFTGSDEVQAAYLNKSVNLYKDLPIQWLAAWNWMGDNEIPDTYGYGGTGMNLCADAATGQPRPGYYEVVNCNN